MAHLPRIQRLECNDFLGISTLKQ